MKNTTNLVPFHPQKGVTMYFEDASYINCVDIDVEPGIYKVTLTGPNPDNNVCGRRIDLRNIMKQFSEVKELSINVDIGLIYISNFMFPNVRWIDSSSPRFQSGPYLIFRYGSRKILKNVFCIKEDEDVQVADATEIYDFAFEGCRKTEGFFSDKVSYINRIHQKAFFGSAFLKLPSVNGVLISEYVIVDVDDEAEEITLPDIVRYYTAPEDMDFKNVKRAVVESADSIRYIKNMPDIICIKRMPGDIVGVMNYSNVKRFEAIGDEVTSINGILYSVNGECLLKCPEGKTGDVMIPEGVKIIYEYAFAHCEISSVSFPSSLRRIENRAFWDSKVEKIDFGTGIQNVGCYSGMIFASCNNLTQIEFPKQIRSVSRQAFFGCKNLSSVVFNEGLIRIEKKAFAGCPNLRYLELPDSLTCVEQECFSNVQTIKVVRPKHWLVSAFLSNESKTPVVNVKQIIVGDKMHEQIYYIPGKLKPSVLKNLKCNYSDTSPKFLDFLKNSYLFAATPELKQDTAYCIYTHCKDEQQREILSKYLRRCAKQIAMRYMESDIKKFADFVDKGLLSTSALKHLLNTANATGNVSAAAYLMEEINNKDTTTFNL